MKFIPFIIILFNLTKTYALTGQYHGAFGDSLQYEIMSTSNANKASKLFVYVAGDGDICEIQKNPYVEDLFKWKKNSPFSSLLGDWVIAEKTIDKYCNRPQRLDGIDYYHRITETSELVKTVMNLRNYNEVYIVGHSAGALLAPLIAINLQDDYPIAGVVMSSMMGRDFSDYMAESMARWYESMGEDFKVVARLYQGITNTFTNIKTECSPAKKSLGPLWGSGLYESIRTDNFYCQQDDDNYVKKLTLLSSNIPVLVMQGDKDGALQSSITETLYRVNQLNTMNKNASFAVVKGMGHGWLKHAKAFFQAIEKWEISF